MTGAYAGLIIDDRFELKAKLDRVSRGSVEAFRASVAGESMEVIVRVFDAEVPEGSAAASELECVARALCRLTHPSLAEALDYGFIGRRLFLVSEWVAGPTLEDVLAGRVPASTADAVRGLAGLLEAIETLHGAGIVHGELRPSSVVIAADGTPRITDAGVTCLEAIARGVGARVDEPAEDLASFGWLTEAWLGAAKRRARNDTDPRVPAAPRAAATPARGTPIITRARTAQNTGELAVPRTAGTATATSRTATARTATARTATATARVALERPSAPALEVDDDDVLIARPARRRDDSLFDLQPSLSAWTLLPRHVAWARGFLSSNPRAYSPSEARSRTINLAITCAISLAMLVIVLGWTRS